MKRTLAALLAVAAPLCAATLDTTVTADTYIRNDGALQNTNGDGDTDNEFLVGDNVGSLRGLLAFDVSPIVTAVNTTGGGNYANLVINSATLELFERRGFARTINVTVNAYGFVFVANSATWNAPATGDTTAGGTIGTVLGSQSVAWDATADSQSAVITLGSADLKSSIQGAPTAGRVNFLLNSTNTGGNSFLSITSDRSTNTVRRAKLVIDYTVIPAGGPELTVDPASPDPDFAFPVASTAASPLTRTLRYKNTGTSGTITVSAVNVTNTTGTAFSLGTVSPALPAVLAVGQSIDIPVLASGAATASFTGSIFVDTDLNLQDKTLPLTASFFLPGTQYAANSSMSASLASWGGASTSVAPGFITAGDGMARVRGIGDPVQPLVNSSHTQAASIPNNLADWELDFRFSPVAPAAFASYAGQSAAGQFADRAFQLVVQSTDAVPAPALTPALDDNTLINLAYLPDGTSTGGIAGFYLFNGTSDTWQLVDFNGDGSALVLAGSVDVDTDGNSLNGVGDGILHTTTGDTVNLYRLTLRGQGFGSAGASYSLTLNGPGAGFPKSVSGLTISHNQAVTAALPASFAFITTDQSDESNPVSGLCPSFWVDEVGYFAVQRPAQRLIAFNTPSTIRSLNGSSPSHVLTLLNDGASASVNVSASLTGTSAVTLTSPPSFPAALAPGAVLDLTLGFDPSLLAAPNTAATGAIGLTSDDPAFAAATYPYLATKVTDANLVANGDFQSDSTGTTFPVAWNTTGTVANSSGSAALAPVSTIWQDFGRGPSVATTDMNNFQVDFQLSVDAFNLGGNRIRLRGATNSGGEDLLAVRFDAAGFQSVDSRTGGLIWQTALATPLAINTNYHIRIIGENFDNVASRRNRFGISTDGVSFTYGAWLTASHTYNATNVWDFETLTFESGAGVNMLVDNVVVKVRPASTFASWMDEFTFAPGADTSANGDADNDGIANIMENVLGTPPNAASAGVTGIGGSAGSVGFQHPLNPSLASDISYSYEWSTDLAEWRASGVANTGLTVVTITAGSPVANLVTVNAAVTTGSAARLFTRVVAASAP